MTTPAHIPEELQSAVAHLRYMADANTSGANSRRRCTPTPPQPTGHPPYGHGNEPTGCGVKPQTLALVMPFEEN